MDTTLEMQIKTTGQEALKVLKELNSSITGLVTTLNKIQGSTSGIENLGKASEKTLGKVDKLSTSFNKLFSAVAGKKFAMKALDFLDSASNRAEELNLFNVIFKNVRKNGEQTFSDLGLEATRFQHKLNEAFGTNMTETLRYQGLFQAMATNQGIGEKYANIMSENMVKLTYDLASLYNKSEKTTAEALRAGVYAGMTKPLRNFGLDVTEKSLKPLLTSLGITDRSVSDMNQAEKEILRYIATLNQAKSAMGDFAETIESPANQVKIFKQQLVEAKVALGNLFMGVYSEVLPYANAFLMVVKEVAKAIADIFGIQAGDYNSGLASTEEIYDGIATGAGNAAKAAKELKRQLLKFDEVNNITTPKKSGSGSGSSGLNTGIDKRLLDAISGYDNLMDKVRMKALDIRDRWMEILGFKKVINPLTGEVEFKYQGLSTTLKNVWNAFKNLNPQAKLFTAIIGGLTVSKIVTGIAKLSKALGTTGLLKNITGLFTPLKTMTGYTKTYWNLIGNAEKGTKKLKSSLIEGVDAWYKSASGAEKLKTGLKGLVANIGGMALISTSLSDIADNGVNLLNVAEGLGGAFSTIAGAVQIGASLGGSTGAIIGGVAGGVEVLIASISGLEDILNTDGQKYRDFQKEISSGYDEWQKSVENLKDAYNQTDSTFDYYERLFNELIQITDENGKIKQGYEDRAKVITGELSSALGIEIEIVDGVIQQYGKLKKSINDLIEQKKAMAKLNALEEEYQKAVKNEGQARKEQAQAYNLLTTAEDELRDRIAKRVRIQNLSNEQIYDYYTGAKTLDDLVKETGADYNNLNEALDKNKSYVKNQIKNYDTAADSYQKASEKLDGYTATIYTWEKMYGLSLKGNYESMNRYFEHERYLFGKSTSERQTYWQTTISENETGLLLLEKNRSKYTEEQYKALKKQYEDNIKLGKDYLEKLQLINATKTEEISTDTIKKWRDMGNKSTEEFLYFFDQLPTDAKKKLVDGLEKNKKSLSKDLQKVINEIKPTLTVDVKGNVAPITQSIRSMVKKFAPFISDERVNSILRNFGLAANGGIFNGSTWKSMPQFANGGMPNHGTAFIAGENGAEIVGNINRRTEVLNRSQIASAIYSAVASAMSQYGGGTSQIDVHVHTDEGTVVDRINQKTKQTGRCPINIPSY